MKRIFTLLLTLVTIGAAQAADYTLSLAYARAYVMNSETHQFQFEFVDMQTYEGQGSIFFCGKDNNHINGTYAIDGASCTALLVVGENQTFEAVSGSFTIEYTREANFMHNYSISGLLTDEAGKTLELSGEFGSYSAYDYSSYEQYLLGNIDYTALVSFELNDYLDAVKNYEIVACDSVSGYSMYNYYVKQYDMEVASWRINLYNERKLIGQMVLYTEDNSHLAGTYDVSRNAVTIYDGSTSVDATTGLYSIAFDHKADSVAFYMLKGSLQHSQGEIKLDCTLPIGDGALADYQSMADNYADSTVAIQYVVLQDYQASSGIRQASTETVMTAKDDVFDLSGRKVKDARRGVYITGRRKIILR